MAKKVFISYSHKDESYRSDLEDHLSMLKRKDVISVWHDREILAGDAWKGKIDENLDQADLVLFLVSPSFLASDYCCDIEVRKALENKAAGKCEIISIVLRPCDWSDCEFSQFQVVPKDARPISMWSNKDEAWLDAINSIKIRLSQFSPVVVALEKKSENDSPTMSEATESWLRDTEIILSHRKVNRILLDDIYVVPDLEYQELDKDESVNIRSALKVLADNESYLLSGEEQQGKTSFLKYCYSEMLKDGLLPIYLDAATIRQSDLFKNLERSLQSQYKNLSVHEYLGDPNRVLLIDNVDSIGLNNKFKSVFFDHINTSFERVVATCHSTYAYVHNEITAFDDYKWAEFLGFGHQKREELAKKWLSLGQEESISDADLYEQCDEAKAWLNIIIKKNIVPPKPIYVLMLLQLFEANTQLNTELTSYGHCYQQLIYQAFENARVRSAEFEKYLNVLSELAWWILVNERDPSDNELKNFFRTYSSIFLPVDREEILVKLVSHSILHSHDFRTGFKYPYIYYFFAGKKIAESYRDSVEVREKVKDLLGLLHREDYANILIFITHHTKDSWVLSEIKVILSSLFVEQHPATLEKSQLAFMADFMKKIPDLVIEQREIQKERDAHNQKLDEFERQEVRKEQEELEPADILANINKTFKGMEVAGQIIRNRHASLTTGAMVDLATSAVSSGLRFLEYFISISDAAKNEVVKVIINHLADKPNLTDKEIERDAEIAYMHLTFGVINGVLRKIASSVGSKEARSIYRTLEANAGTPAVSLIRLSIDLQFDKALDFERVEECSEILKDNAVCTRILKEMVVQHIYMFPVSYKHKQKLSSLLGLSVQGQRLMDRQKTGKA